MFAAVIDALLPKSEAKPAASKSQAKEPVDKAFEYIDILSRVSHMGSEMLLHFQRDRNAPPLPAEVHDPESGMRENRKLAFMESIKDRPAVAKYLALKAEYEKLRGEVNAARESLQKATDRAAVAEPPEVVTAAREVNACREALTEAIKDCNLIIGHIHAAYVPARDTFNSSASIEESTIRREADERCKAAEAAIIPQLTYLAQQFGSAHRTRHLTFAFKLPRAVDFIGEQPQIIPPFDAPPLDFQGRDNPLSPQLLHTVGDQLPRGPK